jgi:hypothetical protein
VLLFAQKRIRHVLPATEDEASIGYDLRTPVVTSVVNERSQNKWGMAQGYQIQVRTSSTSTAGPVPMCWGLCGS